MDFFIRLTSLIKKELLAVLRDKKSRLALIIPPVLQICIFGLSLIHIWYDAQGNRSKPICITLVKNKNLEIHSGPSAPEKDPFADDFKPRNR